MSSKSWERAPPRPPVTLDLTSISEEIIQFCCPANIFCNKKNQFRQFKCDSGSFYCPPTPFPLENFLIGLCLFLTSLCLYDCPSVRTPRILNSLCFPKFAYFITPNRTFCSRKKVLFKPVKAIVIDDISLNVKIRI